MQHDVLKIAVINRTRHKRTYHGFGVLELKDLLLDTRPTTTTPGPTAYSDVLYAVGPGVVLVGEDLALRWLK